MVLAIQMNHQSVGNMTNQMTTWQSQNKDLVARGIDEPTWNALTASIYPGAKPESVIMVVDYCRARHLDPMLKPAHIVPMQVTVKGATKAQDRKEWRDVVMPGIGLYRIQADRSKTYAGADEPEYGPSITRDFHGYDNRKVSATFPEWCSFTVYKIVAGQIVAFKAKEYWLENYATVGTDAPNAMWAKRPYAQLAKCAEAQALRRGWPEIGSEPTAEEMQGKVIDADDLGDLPQLPKASPAPRQAAQTQDATDAEFEPIPGDGESTAAPTAQNNRSADAGGPVAYIKANQVKMIRSKLDRHQTPDADLLNLLQADSVEMIRLEDINRAMDYVNALGKSK